MENNESVSRGRHKSIVLVCLITAALGIYLFIQLNKPTNNAGRPQPVNSGMQAPDFELPQLNGNVVRLSDYKGKIVFLNIWATWCGPCREEMPSMEALYQKMKGSTFEMLAVSIDSQGSTVVEPFVKEHQLNFPVLLDKDGAIGRLYNTTGVPETFIIDKNGVIAAKIIGARNWAEPEVIKTLRNLTNRN